MRKIILIGLAILFLFAAAILIRNLLNKDKINITQKYYSSKEECEKKTFKGCECMSTALDTAKSNPFCEGWQPRSY